MVSVDIDIYNPTIQYFVATAEENWGIPENNRDMLYPYGIEPLDLALYGIDIVNGEFITVQGEEKNRKTTFVMNVLINGQEAMTKKGKKAHERPLVVFDSLESGAKPRKVFNTLVANLASRMLISQGHEPNPSIPCKVCSQHTPGRTTPCKELLLHHKYLLFNKRTPAQQAAIKWALDRMNQWNLHLYGPKPTEGDTRNIEGSITKADSRWRRLCKENEKVIFIADHAQQYIVPGAKDDYGKLIEVVPAQSEIVAKHGAVVFSLSQVSLTSAREASSGAGKYTAAGGRKAAQEANTVFSCNYKSGSGKMLLTVEDARDAGTFSIWQPIEETSGCFFGSPTRVSKIDYRPGMSDQSKNGNGNGKK